MSDETLRYEGFCLGWPAPTSAIPSTLGSDFPKVPTLVLEGQFDTVTTACGARKVASEFPNARYIEVPFVGHVTAFSDHSRCVARIASQFLAANAVDSKRLAHLSAPPVVDAFPETFPSETPIVVIKSRGATRTLRDRPPGNRGRPRRGRRRDVAMGPTPPGQWPRTSRRRLLHVDAGGARDLPCALGAVRWTNDTTVTGDMTTYAGDDSMNGSVDVVTPAARARLRITTSEAFVASTVETISGTVDGRAVNVDVDAKLGL